MDEEQLESVTTEVAAKFYSFGGGVVGLADVVRFVVQRTEKDYVAESKKIARLKAALNYAINNHCDMVGEAQVKLHLQDGDLE